jgi:hypothetical protein
MSLVVEIASVPDRDEVVAEIWHNNEMVAEVQRTTSGGFRLEIYPTESGEPWSFDLEDWLSALSEAQRRLI